MNRTFNKRLDADGLVRIRTRPVPCIACGKRLDDWAMVHYYLRRLCSECVRAEQERDPKAAP